jgi:hypothetical protein
MRYIRPHLDIRVILELNGTFCQEWVLYDFSLVVLHTKSIFFPLVGHGWRQRLNLEVVQPISIHQGPNSI